MDRQLEMSRIPPKAAAVLQIPVRQNCEPVYFRAQIEHHQQQRQSWFLHGNGKECDLQGRFAELDTAYRTTSGFQRTSLRLSITSMRRKPMWNTSFTSTSSRYRFEDVHHRLCGFTNKITGGLAYAKLSVLQRFSLFSRKWLLLDNNTCSKAEENLLTVNKVPNPRMPLKPRSFPTIVFLCLKSY